jgi:hypothetical protein|tara:strand:- start:600 stop:1304 length:705 start_codon:yes stop_codon:yes gene_type:complete
MLKKLKKKNKKVYFGIDVQDAIVRYNNTDNPVIRNEIYYEEIAYAFDKLCENIINTFKFSYFDSHFEDVKNEVISFLVLNMHKYDDSKGFKAFSYFSVVAKNYLILNNNNNYRMLKTHNSNKNTKSIAVASMGHLAKNDKSEDIKAFFNEMVEFFEDKIEDIFKKQDDIKIAYSVIKLFNERNNLENFNKKGLYLLIREMTGVQTSKITKVINVMKLHYIKMNKKFREVGTISF